MFFAGGFMAPVKAARSLHIAGLVVNAGTLEPVGSAMIYDAGNHLLGTTDANGYYNVSLQVAQEGEIYFSLRIRKPGYYEFGQNEHWGNLPDGAKALFYFGIKKKGDKGDSFSKLINRSPDSNLDYASVKDSFSEVKTGYYFNNKLEQAKAGNQDVLLRIDGAYYIADDSGWIKLNSDHDLILLNKKQVIAADKLNGLVKRRKVKMMTPITSSSAQFAIDTR